MEHDILLRRAEMSWRIHHIIKFMAAYSVDVSTQSIHLRNHMFSQCAVEDRLGRNLKSLCDYLESTSLMYHPWLTRQPEGMKMLAEVHSIAGPCLRYEIDKYINSDKPNRKLAIEAYKRNPKSRRIRYEFMTAHYSRSAICAPDVSLSEATIWDKKQIYFLPAIEMAVGHYSVLVDFLELRKRMGLKANVSIITTTYASNPELLDLLIRKYSPISLHPYQQTKYWTLDKLSELWDGHIRHFWFNSVERQTVHNYTRDRPNGRIVVLHLRTGTFKQNEGSMSMNLRSVKPSSYRLLVQYLINIGYNIVQISADKHPEFIEGIRSLHVLDNISKVKQWEEIASASFIIGTASGISHFTGFTGYCGLLTNYTCPPYENIIGEYTLVACKRFKPKITCRAISKKEIARMYLSHWTDGTPCLADHVIIEDQSESDLLDCVTEYISLINGTWSGDTISTIFSRHGVNFSNLFCFRDYKLCKSSANDLARLLECCGDPADKE